MSGFSKRSQVAPFLAMNVVAEATRLQAQGKDIISMAVGQPGAPAPSTAIAAASNALKTGKIGYTQAQGILALRARIARHYHDTYDVEVDPERVIITTGSSAGFTLAFLCLFDPGARIAIPSPGYPAYRNIISALGLEVVEIRASEESRWSLNAQLLEDANCEKPIDGLLFANPNNPNGTMINREKFRQLLDKANELEIKFISDEIYHGITYDEPGTSALEIADEPIIINSFSKYFCMTGWRIGWMIAPEALIPTLHRLQQNLFICAPEISQIAATAAFDGKDEMELVKQGYEKNRAMFLERLPKLDITNIQPIDGAFYAYADVSPLTNSASQLADELLQQTGVAMTPGLDFDLERGDNWMRLSFAGEYDRMKEGFDRLDDWLKNR